MNPQPPRPREPQQDPDATMLVPTPGGQRAAPAPARSPPAEAPPAPAEAAPAHLPGIGLNPLVQAANPLLDLVVPLRTNSQPPNLQQLRERLAAAVREFEAKAGAAGADRESVAAARYALCTLLDETIATTAWGCGIWGTRSLLVTFHNEAFGGEKVFQILQRLSQNPAAYVNVLELYYLCLALGLEGRYRMLDRGHEQLAVLRERLAQLIRRQRGHYEPALAPDWRPAAVARTAPLRGVPLWVLGAAGCVLLLAAHLVAGTLLNRKSDPVFASLSRIALARPAPPARDPARDPAAPARPAAPAPARLAGFLAPDIARGLVSVRETGERSTVTVHGDGMFAAGSAEVADAFLPLLARIGDALRTQPGKVVVVGHTDDTRPGLSARYPSNFDLSQARAERVTTLLAERAGPAVRYSAEGRGEAEPLYANDTPANRARNRRVDIVLLTPPGAP